MAVTAEDFFVHIDKFMDYRKVVYETSDQTLKSNRTDLKLFREFIENQAYPAIDGPAVMDFQYYLKKDRGNTGGSINRKIFTLRIYSHFLILQDVKDADDLPFYDVLKVRQGYRNRPNALTIDQVKCLFEGIDRNTCLGIRDYAVYALMYQTGLRVGEVHTLDISSIDFENQTLEVIGKGNKRRILHLTDEMVQILIEWLAVRNRFYKSNETDRSELRHICQIQYKLSYAEA
jgi:site-specific recombinase XerD